MLCLNLYIEDKRNNDWTRNPFGELEPDKHHDRKKI